MTKSSRPTRPSGPKLKKGLQDANVQPPRPPAPTMAIPGTEAKIRVMEQRVKDGYTPHHPLDYVEERNPT